jgi:hypothetical protein
MSTLAIPPKEKFDEKIMKSETKEKKKIIKKR